MTMPGDTAIVSCQLRPLATNDQLTLPSLEPGHYCGLKQNGFHNLSNKLQLQWLEMKQTVNFNEFSLSV